MKPAQYPGQPAPIWEHFYQLTRIPRPSGQEAAVRQYVIDLAEQAGHSWHCDSAGNLAVAVPATAGLEQRPVVVIQNHLDMVTVKTGDKSHDFTTQPLDLVVEDGWLRADRTTLGADNGLGCAAALALMTDDDVAYALEVFANRPAPAAAQATTQPADPAADPADDTAVDVPSIAISAASRRRRLTQVAAS